MQHLQDTANSKEYSANDSHQNIGEIKDFVADEVFLDVALWFPTTPIIMGVTPTGYAWDMSPAISVSVPYVPRTFSAVTAVQCEVTYCKLSLLSKPERRSKGQQILQRSFQTTGEFCSCRQAK